MVKRSKRYEAAAAKIDRSRQYDSAEAFELLKALPSAKFNETVDVVVKLGVDPRKSDQLVRGAVSLPKGLGKAVVVAVFAEGDEAAAAEAAGQYDRAAELYERVISVDSAWVSAAFGLARCRAAAGDRPGGELSTPLRP